MDEYSNIETKVYRGCGFMTVSKYSNSGDKIYIADKDSKTITSIDTTDYSISNTFDGHKGIIWNLDTSKDDSVLISTSGDLTICFFNTSNSQILHQINERNIPKYVSVQKKNLQTNLVAIICEALTKRSSTCISIYDLDLVGTSEFGEKIRLGWNRTSKPNVLLWLNETILIVGCDNGTIVLRNINDPDGSNETEYKFHTDSIKSLVWNKSFTGILTGSLDCTSKHINVSKWEILSTYESTVPINWACWNHNDRKVFVGGGIEAMNVAKTSNNDLNLKIYRVSDNKLTNHIGSHFGPIRYIDKSPCNKNFVTSSQDGTVKIYFVKEETQEEVSNSNPNSNLNPSELEKQDIDNEINSKKVYLVSETNKMLNLNWKPPKQNQNNNKPVSKWVPGMPKSAQGNSQSTGSYQINNLDEGMQKKLEQAKKEAEENNSTIRVTNLPNTIKPRDLLDMFDLYGRIEERGGIKIKQYDDTTMAFIKYVYPESALKAIDNMDGIPMEHHIVRVELAKQR